MSPTERLIAAAEKIERQCANLPERHQDPWSGLLGRNGWTDIVSEAWDQDGNGHRSFVCQVHEERSADAIITAVNVMPIVALWLRETARAYPSDMAVDNPALTLAYRILTGGQR